MQETLYNEILGRIQETDLSVPVKRDDYFYYTRTEEGKAYAIYCRKHGSLDAPEEILLDANALATGEKYFRLGNFAVSPDHRLLAYSADVEGDEAYTIYVKDLAAGELLPDRIPNTYYTLEWANDNHTFFYTTLDLARRPYRVFRHQLGARSDELVYQEDDARFALGLGKTRSRRFLFLHLSSALTSEVRYLDAHDPLGWFRVMLPRTQEVEYDASHHGDFFYIRTNEAAKNFRLMRTPVANPSRDNWEEVLPASRRRSRSRASTRSKITWWSTSANAAWRKSRSTIRTALSATTSSFPSRSIQWARAATRNIGPERCASLTRRW